MNEWTQPVKGSADADAGSDVLEQPLSHLDQLWFQVAGTRCNLTCHHCFISCSPHNDRFGFLTLDEVRRRLCEAESIGVKEFYFTGGEPFLHPDLTQMLMETLKVGPATVLTNATVLKDAWLKQLQAAARASLYCLEFRVSLDGFSPETNDPIRGDGVFARTLAGIVQLSEYGFLPIVTAARTWPESQEQEVVNGFVQLLRAAGCSRPRLKILPALQLGAEAERTRGYEPAERIEPWMLENFDRTQLLCEHSRIVTDRGVHVCPILIEAPDSLLSDDLCGRGRLSAEPRGVLHLLSTRRHLCQWFDAGEPGRQPPQRWRGRGWRRWGRWGRVEGRVVVSDLPMAWVDPAHENGAAGENGCETIACFGGIYSNYLALEAAIRDARVRGAERLYCLGDMGASGPHPNRVFPLLHEHNVICLQGNYDDSIGHALADCQCGYTDPRDNYFAQISYDYTLANTSNANRRYLRELPKWRREVWGSTRVLMCHGSPRRVNEFLWESTTSTAFLNWLCEQTQADLILATHTGLKWERRLASGRRFVNVGALGRPENDGRTEVWYALVRLGSAGASANHPLGVHVEFVPVEYDHERLAQEMESEGLPCEFVETITSGYWTSCLESLPAKERSRGRM